MCGICGFFSKRANLGKDSLEKMNASQAHRGPDDSGLFFREGVGLGHKRLSVIDLSPKAHQPMFNEDQSLVVVFNGTIFNFRELREGLLKKGHRFLSQSDTEVLIHLYEEKKEEMLKDLKGQFAFAIWDVRERRMFLARDRLGIKPLYYIRQGETFLFASEVKSVLASGVVPRELDPNGLVSFLECNSVAPPSTIFRGIEVLPAGHYLIFDGDNTSIRQYWDMKFSSHQKGLSFDEYKSKLRNSLFESVDSMLVGDVPVGVFLSGGIDSSVISGILKELGRSDIETFSIGFSDSAYNELPYARQVAEQNRSKHHEIEITPRHLIEELPQIIRAMDQPTGDGLNTYLISKHTRKHVTVALSGLGGDELFFGYHMFRMVPKVLSITRPLFSLPEGFRQRIFSLVQGLTGSLGVNGRFSEVLRGSDPFSSAYLAMRKVFPEDAVWNSLWKRRPDKFPFQALVADCAKSCRDLPSQEAVSYMELKTYMQNTLLRDSDSMAMRHALEVRFPLLDESILDLAAEIPPAYKHGKKIFIESVKDLIPPEVQTRKKMGFSFPLPLWMKGELKPMIQRRLAPDRVKKTGIFNHYTVEGILNRFYHGNCVDYRMLWSLFIFDCWLEVHVENCELELE